jgi:hypothetical protein
MSSSAITGPIFTDVRRSPSGSAAAPSWSFNDSQGTGVYLVSADVLGLSTAGVQRVVVTAAGDVGIGTGSPAARLNIQSIGNWSSFNYGKGLYVSAAAGATNPAIGISDLNGTNNWAIVNSAGTLQFAAMPAITDSTTGPNPRMSIFTDGGFYLNATKSTGYNAASESTLGVFGASNDTAVNSGAVYNIEWKMSGGAGGQFWYASYITRNGARTLGAVCTGTSWVNASDIKNKEQIEGISYGLQTVLACRPVNFSWKTMRDEDGSGKKDIGFIAQELEELIPEVVTGDEGQKGVSYGNLVAVAFKAIQEQQEIIAALEARLAALESK